MRPTTILFVLALALYGCASQQTAQNNNPSNNNNSDKSIEQNGSNTLELDEPEYTVHIVQSGESLSIIAKRYGVTVEDLVNLNDITDMDLIVIGQEILVPKPKEEGGL